jgi:transcriptional antiterminator
MAVAPRLDTRQAGIVLALLEAHEPLPAKTIAAHLGLSPRMIRYEFPVVANWIAGHGGKAILKPRTGLRLEASPPIRKAIRTLIANDFHPLLLLHSQRQQVLLFLLLAHEGNLSISTMEEAVCVSRATLSRDLARVESWLAAHRLLLRRRPRLGASVIGGEEDLRHAIVSVILEADLEPMLLELCLWGRWASHEGEIDANPAQRIIMTQLQGWRLHDGWRFVSRVENGLDCRFVDGDHLWLALCWALAMRRTSARHFVEIADNVIQAELQTVEFLSIRDSSNSLLKSGGLKLPLAELVQLTLEVEGCTRQPRDSGSDRGPGLSKVLEEHMPIAERMVALIGERVGTDLSNPEVIIRLAEHLSRILLSIHHGLPIRNPLVFRVQDAYPVLWRATTEAAASMREVLGGPIPPEEVAYITMYAAIALGLSGHTDPSTHKRVMVACPTGGVTAWMLLSRLKAELPELVVVDTVQIRQLARIDPSQVDAIISTARFSVRDLPVITVSPMLDERDLALIRETLDLPGHVRSPLSREYTTPLKAHGGALPTGI